MSRQNTNKSLPEEYPNVYPGAYPPQGYPPQPYYPPQSYNPESFRGGYPQPQGYPPQEYPRYPPQEYPGYPPQEYRRYPPQEYPGYPPREYLQGYPPSVYPDPQRGYIPQGHGPPDYLPVVDNSSRLPQHREPQGYPLEDKSRRTQNQLVVHHAKAIVYSCMDFRLLDDIVRFMDSLGYNNNYDQFILAGASLAFVNDQFQAWKKTGEDHLDLAIKLHGIQKIICIEHEECGAYKMVYPNLKPENEKDQHVQNVIIFENKIKETHPELKVHAYYMHINGNCEKIN